MGSKHAVSRSLYLGRRIRERSAHRVHHLAGLERAAEPKVGDLDDLGLDVGEENVLGLEIAVGDVIRVAELDAVQDLPEDVPRPLRRPEGKKWP